MAVLPVNNILFLDIETVPRYSSYSELPENWKSLWDHKASFLIRNKETETAESVYPRAGIYAEFGKIICIGCGIILGNGENKKISIKCFAGDDEHLLLTQFSEMLHKWSPNGAKYLCAHNGKEFDFPYLCRRFVVNRIPIPPVLQLSGKKPWEVNHLDTLELWKFGDFKSYTSLNLLAQTLEIATPKDDIDGSMVWEVYWKEKNLERIVVYCRKDVLTLAQIFLRMNGDSLIKSENIEIKQ
ncbi:MAG: ribonuclease H-like domain-containing protein [Bacteroidetes bacterium]|nr:ribonuclease H-like domain-containing protein [Bacteroidota bacterium]